MEALLLSTLGALGVLVYIRHDREKGIAPINHLVGKELLKISTDKPSIRIIVPSGSSGTDFDAQVYQKLFGGIVVYVDIQSPQTYPKIGEYYDINLWVERLFFPELFPCRTTWMMINQEMLRTDEPLDTVNVFLCKTRYAEGLIKKYISANNLKSKAIYTAHTSRDLGLTQPRSKDYRLAVHFAGKSWLKGTYRLIKAWVRTDPQAELVVTCRDYCLDSDKLKKFLSYYFTLTSGGGGVEEIYSTPRTKIRLIKFLPTDQLDELQSRAGIWLCPSEVEGYGHYINEGRSAGAVVVTTNYPPMNELVSEKDGFLVNLGWGTKVIQEGMLPGSSRVFPQTRDLMTTLKRVFDTPKNQLMEKGQRARERYLADDELLTMTGHHLMAGDERLLH